MGTGSKSEVLSGALLIKIKTCSGVKGWNVSKKQGLGQGEKLGGAAFSVADRTDSTLCEKNLEKASAVA